MKSLEPYGQQTMNKEGFPSMSSVQTPVKLSSQTRIGVLYGGLSSERKVSLISGQNCFDALKRLGYENAELIDVNHHIAQTLAEKRIEVAYIALHGKFGEDGCIQGLLELMGIPYTGCRVAASALTMNKATTKSVLKDAGLPVIDSVVIKAGTVNGKAVRYRAELPGDGQTHQRGLQHRHEQGGQGRGPERGPHHGL
nr:D-ala D-ala ligase N-terminus [uncultured bacterium]